MKVALCFAGQLRNIQVTYDGWMGPNVIQPNKHLDLDVFVHGWFDNENVNNFYESAVGRQASDVVPSNIVEIIYNNYNPKSLRLQKQIHFDVPEKKYNGRKYPFINPQYTTSRLYSTKQVFTDVMNSNESYDLIVLTRWDWVMYSAVLFENYNDGSFWHMGCNPHGINVGFVCAPPNLMQIYTSLYDEQERLFDMGVSYCDEILAQKLLENNNVPVNSMNIKNSIHRGWKIG